MSDRPSAFQTAHGMAWYPEDAESRIFVDRLATYRGSAVLLIRSQWVGSTVDDGERLQITVSPKGRNVRVHGRDGREWRPVDE